MNQRILSGLAAMILGAAVCGAGCGGKSAGPPVDTKPFEAAIVEYLQRQNFGMKIAKVERIDQHDDAATAVCKMQEAEGTYALAVTWEFALRRTDGAWQVETYTAK